MQPYNRHNTTPKCKHVRKCYDELVALVGPPSNAYPDKQALADEYVAGIDLESVATPFQARLILYGNQPISTFSILA